jgi:hypothetical protein
LTNVSPVTLDYLTERLGLADQLLDGRRTMFAPQDLPGRYGQVVRAVDHLLAVMQCPPTTIRHPLAMGGQGFALAYVNLPALVELKIAAGRIGDEHDVVELIRANSDQVDLISVWMEAVHDHIPSGVLRPFPCPVSGLVQPRA